MPPSLRPARATEANLEGHGITRPPVVVESPRGVVAIIGAEPFGDGCELWLAPGLEIGEHLLWLIHHSHDLLREVCFGRYVVASIEPGDRAMELFAERAGFETLESQGGRDLHYLSIV